jgi:hypothetical protein
MQDGYEVIFIMPMNRRQMGKLVSEWVEDKARELGITRMTKRTDAEGIGAHSHHSAHFFELADQPVEIMFALDKEQSDRLIAAMENAGINVFCIRRPVHYGQLGTAKD